MDILISSNLERLIYHICGNSWEKNAALMKELSEKGVYRITDDMKEALSRFAAGYATEEDTQDAIRALYEKEGYVIDPHTAVAASVYGKLRKEGLGEEPCVIASTASPFKFEKSVMKALGEDTSLSDLELADRLSAIAGVKVPAAVESLRSAKVRHTTVCGKSRDEMLAEVRKFLGI